MACPGEGILTDLTRRLVDKSIKEVNYFRHFETHDHEFKQDKKLLIRKLEKVRKDIEDAKRNNQYQIEGEVQDWIKYADNLIHDKAEIRPTRFDSWCPLGQYRQGKRLAQRALTLKDHIKKCNFEIVARPAELLDMKYHASRDFIDFESRKTTFKKLVGALEDGNHYMIGLHGMGGTGKTILATQVGKHVEESKAFEKVGKQVEESKAFEKVIFVVVSNPPDVNKIRGDIARQLGLRLEESKEADHSKLLWSRIYKNEKKLLIILDDVWGELNLTEIGIPSGLDHRNCYVLITTRHLQVCEVMRCQQIFQLDTLDDDEAFNLFLFHPTSDDDDSSRNELEGLARDFLKECGGLPVAIVALASTLRNWDVGELKAALTALQNSKPFVDVDDDLVKVYNCLRLSYDNLHNEKAQKLFLLCSIFPKDSKFPINLVIRLGIGSGIFEDADDYCAARTQALAAIKKLIDSSLLQKVGEKECVKMHDLVREVAQWIAKEDIQVIKDSRTTLKTNKRFVFWSTDDFPDQFDDTKLEILLLWISGNVLVKDPNAFFARMSRLKILFLLGEYDRKVPSPSLSKSLLSLKYIHTLILDGWELGDISILKNIQSLVILEFKNCLIIELPKNIGELKKLRCLGLRKCEIQRKNPFEVIKRCSQLEELYFVENYNVKDWNTEDDKEIEDEIAQDIPPAELQIFSIAYDGFEYFADDDNGLLRCFNPEHIRRLIPNAMFKYLVRSAEVLELGRIGQTSWKNLAPDIIPLENGGKDNLTKLYLYEWDDIECLIDNSKYRDSNTTFFSKLVELHLYRVDVKKLYWGAMPSLFLWQLQILELEECVKLQNIFCDENIKLPHLKVLRLIGCPMFQPSIFQPFVAQSLVRLEELVVEGCEELKSLIAYESLKQEMIVVGSQKNHGLLFPALKSLQIGRCGKLEMVFSLLLPGDLPKLEDLYINDCEELKYIFGEYRVVGQVLQQEIILPLLTGVELYDVPCFISIFQNCQKSVLRPPQVFKEDSKEKHENSKASAFSWAYGCCFLADIGVPNAAMEHHTISQGSCGSSKRMEIVHTAECLMRHPLSLQNIRQMTLWGCSKLKSLFSVSTATIIMFETLEIGNCEELKEIITNEVEDDDHLNCISIFPKLQSLYVFNCNKLKTLFSVSICRNQPQLSTLYIREHEELVNVVEDDSNDHHHMKYSSIFPKLEDLSIEDCNMLEFIFPLSLFGSLQKFKSLIIKEAAELNCILGNESDELHINLPTTLERLSFVGVPKIMNKILAKKYHVSFLSLQSIELGDLQEFNGRSFLDLIAYLQEMQLNMKVPKDLMKIIKDVQKLTKLGIRDSKIEEVLNLEGVEIEGTILTLSLEEMWLKDLSELNHICKGPKYILSLPNLCQLDIFACKKLRVIFSMSIVKGLPQLSVLKIEDCNELVDIIEERSEGHLDQICFPKLEEISINCCNSLKCLFSISTCGMFPKLRLLKIEEASDLEQVFIHKQDDIQKTTIMDEVFPELSNVTLRKLPRLVTIYEGIDYQTLEECVVDDCPKFQGINHIQEGLEDGDSENQVATNALPDFVESSRDAMKTNVEEVVSSMVPELEDEHKTIESTTQFQHEDLVETKTTTEAPHKINTPLGDYSIDVTLKERSEQSPTLEDVAVANLKPRNSLAYKEIEKEVVKAMPASSLLISPDFKGFIEQPRTEQNLVASMKEKHEQGSKGDDATWKAAIAIQSTDSESMKQTRVSSIIAQTVTSSVVSLEGSKSGPSTLSLEKIEKEAVRIQTSQLSIDPTWTNSEITQSIKDTKEHGHEENYAEEYSYSRKQSIGSIDNLLRKDSALSAKETTKGIDENATATYKSPMAIPFTRALTIKETRDCSSIQEEAESEKPIKVTLPQVIPSLHYLSHIADAGTSFSKLGICEIFKLVEQKHGETTLLAQALEQYPQLMLPCEHRTHRIIAWSYRVLVDILVMLATKTPNTITSFEKSTLEANLSEAIVLGFDKDWVEFVRAKVFGDDMSDISKAKEEIQVMEVKLREIDSQLLGLSEDRKKLIVNMNMFRDIVSAKDKPFGI